MNECVELCECLVSLILSVDSTISIAFSSLTTQRHYSHRIWIREFNARIKDMCRDNSLTFIDNSNIELRHLARDRHHLRSGIPVHGKNFISFIHGYSLLNSQDYSEVVTSLEEYINSLNSNVTCDVTLSITNVKNVMFAKVSSYPCGDHVKNCNRWFL